MREVFSLARHASLGKYAAPRDRLEILGIQVQGGEIIPGFQSRINRLARDYVYECRNNPAVKYSARPGKLITEDENWDSEARDILARYPRHRVVIVDAHI